MSFELALLKQRIDAMRFAESKGMQNARSALRDDIARRIASQPSLLLLLDEDTDAFIDELKR